MLTWPDLWKCFAGLVFLAARFVATVGTMLDTVTARSPDHAFFVGARVQLVRTDEIIIKAT